MSYHDIWEDFEIIVKIDLPSPGSKDSNKVIIILESTSDQV